MNPGDVVVVPVPPAAGTTKDRPALVLSVLPGRYGDLLVCGISSQLRQLAPGWDELIQPGDTDFSTSGLHRASVIRLSFLYAAAPGQVRGLLGQIDPARLVRLQTRLADHLRP